MIFTGLGSNHSTFPIKTGNCGFDVLRVNDRRNLGFEVGERIVRGH